MEKPSRITLDMLTEGCGKSLRQLNAYQAENAALSLGPLAHWWLRPKVLAQLGAETRVRIKSPATLPLPDRTKGSCLVLFVNKQVESCPLLRPVLPLPLRWLESATDSPCLPTGLHALAKRLKAALPGSTRWRLAPGDCIAGIDLSALRFEYASGWAPLAGGLLLAMEDGLPDPKVWATGAWQARAGITEVEGLKEKMALAEEFGASKLFIPEGQIKPQLRSKSRRFKIMPLPVGKTRPAEALDEFVTESIRRPPIDASFSAHRTYYMRLRGEKEKYAYYVRHILEHVVQACRKQLSLTVPPRVLVTILSSPELVLIGSRTLDPKLTLLLYTKEKKAQAVELQKELGSGNRRCVIQEFDNRPEGLRDAAGAHLQGVPGHALVFDLTPGNKWMSYVLAVELAQKRKKSRLCYLENKVRGRQIDPGGERIIVWEAGGKVPLGSALAAKSSPAD